MPVNEVFVVYEKEARSQRGPVQPYIDFAGVAMTTL